MNSLYEILNWLSTVECRAHDLYTEVAGRFKTNEKVFSFFSHLAKDEHHHLSIVQDLKSILSNHNPIQSDVIVSEEIKRSVCEHFKLLEDLINENGELERIITSLVEIEISEMNEYFSYVMLHIKRYSDKYETIDQEFKEHLEEIINFVNTIPEGDKARGILEKLQTRLDCKILYVDDCAITSLFIESLLGNMYSVETASSITRGLELINREVYDVMILSDHYESGTENGESFFNTIKGLYPAISERVIIITTANDEKEYIKSNKLQSISKPFSSDTIKKNIVRVLNKK